MNRILYLDCFSGVSGSMWLAALLHLGERDAPGLAGAGQGRTALLEVLEKLSLPPFQLNDTMCSKSGIQGGYLDPQLVTPSDRVWSGSALLEKVGKSTLPRPVRTKSVKVLETLLDAMAKVRGEAQDAISFSEYHAMDTLVDVVGVCSLMHALSEQYGVTQVLASPIQMGRGLMHKRDRQIPVPNPVALHILRGVPIYGDIDGYEVTTPTGAVLLKGWVDDFSPLPKLQVDAVGYGHGTWELVHPNVLRLYLGQTYRIQETPPVDGTGYLGKVRETPVGADGGHFETDEMMLVETNIDDMNPEFYDHVQEVLFQAGAVDVYWTQVTMKKHRPATCLRALVSQLQIDPVLVALFRETTAIGTRIIPVQRKMLRRHTQQVDLGYGSAEVKIASLNGEVLNVQPEYEACRALARTQGIPLKQVYDDAKQYALAKSRSNPHVLDE